MPALNKNAAAFLGTRPKISESHSEISTRAPFCIAAGPAGAVSVRVSGSDDSAACDGTYLACAEERNGRMCFTKDGRDGAGALYFDGTYWKVCSNGSGPSKPLLLLAARTLNATRSIPGQSRVTLIPRPLPQR